MTAATTETERGFQDALLELAAVLGWRRAHFRPALTKHGWRTPVQGDAGFPDLVLARGGRIIFAELKSDTGRTTEAQTLWLQSLAGCRGVETHLWKPADWPEIEAALR